MDLIGDEKRIRALFSELKFAEEQTAPGFAATWQRAQARSRRPQRAFNLSFVTVTALLVFVFGSLTIWSRLAQPSAPASAYANIPASSDGFASHVVPQTNIAGTTGPVKYSRAPISPRRSSKSTTQRQMIQIANNQVVTEAKAIENWQSPTASLLSSPSDDLFKSLPQLNENANEMKSFLPSRANDKEK